MAEAVDLGIAILAVAVADGHLADLEAAAGGAEEEVEVAEWIEVSEEVPAGHNLLVVLICAKLTALRLRSSHRVGFS